MDIAELSTCFCTKEIEKCRAFYTQYLGAKVTFDCGWYSNLSFGENGPTIQFMEPQSEMPLFDGQGIMLNFKVDDVDAEHDRLVAAGLQTVMPLEDHPWGDRGFSVCDPIGNNVYIYADRPPTDEFKKFYSE